MQKRAEKGADIPRLHTREPKVLPLMQRYVTTLGNYLSRLNQYYMLLLVLKFSVTLSFAYALRQPLLVQIVEVWMCKPLGVELNDGRGSLPVFFLAKHVDISCF